MDERFFERLSPSELQDFRVKHRLEQPFLFFIGERRPHKNLPGLLRAFQAFQRLSGQPCELVIAGKAYADYRLPEELSRALGLEGAVRFVSEVPEAELPGYYQSAAAFVFLSSYEGVGFPVLEAMASGTPVVAANCTSLPEVVGEGGILVPPDEPRRAADAIGAVVYPGPTRERYIEQGEARAREFTWERCASLTRQVYLEALEI